MDTADEWWTAQDCATYLGIKPRTWHAYTRRPGNKNPVPQPIRKIGATPIWNATEVRTYATHRQRKTRREH